ncbi:MAG: alpha/beta hydrolase [Proteobacteria bacterium]|nr:alpha/beta hydrolase [Pseudomonadota bacterium]
MQLIPSSDNIQIAAESIGTGPALIFAHGLTSHRRISRLQLESLASRYRLMLFDQRGHGESSAVTDPALYTAERMADDLRAVLDAADVDRAVIGGESMGAATALTFALKYPDRVQTLLLTAPAFGETVNSEHNRLVEMGENLSHLGMTKFLARSAEVQRSQFNWSADLIELVAGMQRAHDPLSLATALKTVADWLPFPDLSVVAKLTCPVCILAWEQDPLHPIALARRMVDTFPNARLKTMAPLPALFLDLPQVGRLYGEFLEAE